MLRFCSAVNSNVQLYEDDLYIRQTIMVLHMLESLNLAAYIALGFAISYLALEGGWHFTACKIKENSVPPCIFKQVKMILIENSRVQ